eukprot:g29695.t1
MDQGEDKTREKENATGPATGSFSKEANRLVQASTSSCEESLRFLRRIELRTALDCILLDFRRRRSLAQDSPVVFYLAIDDAGQTLLKDVENAQAARSFLKDISNAAGSWLLRPPRSVFPITLITGTTAQAIGSILSTESSHPYVSLPVPLLPLNESDAILRELGLEDWANDGQVQQLLADIGGLPRLLEILFSSLQQLVKRGQRPTNASWATVQRALMTFVEQRTGHLNEEVVHAIVRAALTRETMTNEDVAHGQQTWGDLERCGAVFLREQKQGGMVVEVPYLMIEGKVRNLKKRRLPDVVEALFRVPEQALFVLEKSDNSSHGRGFVPRGQVMHEAAQLAVEGPRPCRPREIAPEADEEKSDDDEGKRSTRDDYVPPPPPEYNTGVESKRGVLWECSGGKRGHQGNGQETEGHSGQRRGKEVLNSSSEAVEGDGDNR